MRVSRLTVFGMTALAIGCASAAANPNILTPLGAHLTQNAKTGAPVPLRIDPNAHVVISKAGNLPAASFAPMQADRGEKVFDQTCATCHQPEKFIGPERMEFWKNAIFTLPTNHVLGAGEPPELVLWMPLTVTFIGFVAAWYAYVLHEGMGARIAAKKGPLWSFLYNKWYFDELYEFIFVRGAKLLGDLFWKGGDQKIIDGFGPDGVAAASEAVGKGAGRIQSGYVYHYAFVMLLGIAGLLTFALIAWRG